MDYQSGFHTKYDIKYYFVWITRSCQIKIGQRLKTSDTELSKSRNKYSKLSYSAKPCTFVSFMSSDFVPSKDNSIFERPKLANASERIFVIEKAILGATFVGNRIFLCDCRSYKRRNDKRIYRKT